MLVLAAAGDDGDDDDDDDARRGVGAAAREESRWAMRELLPRRAQPRIRLFVCSLERRGVTSAGSLSSVGVGRGE
jgi:hypothetical protein